MSAIVPIRAVSASVVERFSLSHLAEPIAFNLRADSAWSPRFQADLTLAPFEWPSEAWAKRQGDWIVVLMETIYRERFMLADITAEHGGDLASVTAAFGGDLGKITDHYSHPWHAQEAILPLSAWTEMWGGDLAAVTADVGGDLAQITARMRQPGGSYLPPPAERLLARLRVRSTSEPDGEGVVTYRLASDDARAHDYRRTELTPWVSPHTSLRALVEAMLARLTAVEGPPLLRPGPDLVIPAGLTWDTGVTLWDALHPTLEAIGWELYADLDGEWVLQPIQTTTAPMSLDPDVNLMEYDPDTDRASAYADGAVVEYPDSDSGLIEDRWDVYTMPGATRILYETRSGKKPGNGAAQELVERARARGTTARARSTLALPLTPGQRVQIVRPTFPIYGTIQSLAHDYGNAETTYTLRDINTT